MNLTEETLAEITEFAKLSEFTPGMIALASGVDEHFFLASLQDPESEIYKAYHKGQLLSRAEMDKKIAQLSNQGSGPAQSLLYKMNQDTRYFKMLEQYG